MDSNFTAQELLRGYKFLGGTKVYCCYGSYCEAGHSDDCPGRTLVEAGRLTPPVQATSGKLADEKGNRDA